MKHKLSITLLLLVMFFATQIIGIFVLNAYAPTVTEVYNETSGEIETMVEREPLPFGMEYTDDAGPMGIFISIITALILAIVVYAFLMHYDMRLIIKLWFTLVIFLALSLALFPFMKYLTSVNASLIAAVIALPLVYFKVLRPNAYVHNLTELLIYPGIAVVMVALLFTGVGNISGVYIIIALLLAISVYDAWAVWKSGIMQKMAKYQMEQLNIFGGFLLPSMTKKEKEKLKAFKEKYKGKKKVSKEDKKKKFKVNLAILGGGDVIFPIITAGVFMWTFPEQMLFGIKGLIPALFVIGGATLGLTYLFINTKKDRAYPAMPYISAGIFIGMLCWKLLFY